MQAARGTTVGDISGSASTPAAPRPASRRRHLLLFAGVALTLYALDVVTKILAVEHLTDRPDVPVVGDFLVLHLVRNPGAAFSAGTEYTVVLSLASIIAVLVVLWYSRRLGSTAWAIGLGALLGGVGGNLTDRLLRAPGPLRGHVVDMFMLPNWPVFNVADMCINLGAALMLVQALRGVRVDGQRYADLDGEDADADPDADPDADRGSGDGEDPGTDPDTDEGAATSGDRDDERRQVDP